MLSIKILNKSKSLSFPISSFHLHIQLNVFSLTLDTSTESALLILNAVFLKMFPVLRNEYEKFSAENTKWVTKSNMFLVLAIYWSMIDFKWKVKYWQISIELSAMSQNVRLQLKCTLPCRNIRTRAKCYFLTKQHTFHYKSLKTVESTFCSSSNEFFKPKISRPVGPWSKYCHFKNWPNFRLFTWWIDSNFAP